MTSQWADRFLVAIWVGSLIGFVIPWTLALWRTLKRYWLREMNRHEHDKDGE